MPASFGGASEEGVEGREGGTEGRERRAEGKEEEGEGRVARLVGLYNTHTEKMRCRAIFADF